MHSSDEDFARFIQVLVVEDMISPGIHKEKLSALIDPPCPAQVKEFFSFLREHITIESSGMGASLRENRGNLALLMERYDWDYPIYSGFISLYENALMQSYSESIDTKK